MLDRIREWRIDRMTDRVARRPSGRAARETYGSDDVHSFAWEPVLEALQLGPHDHLLDVGCGGGVFLRRVLDTGCGAVGVDHSHAMVQLARRTTGGRAPIVQASADRLPFPRSAFTAVSTLVAFFFFPDPVAALQEFRRVVDDEHGRIAVYTTAPEMKGTPAAPYPLATRGHFYEDDELASHARAAGFASVEVRRPEPGGAQLLVARP
ncbi:MAG TPA: methyltransferase domain-containing protein [Gaiellaceae bacterium]|jgi:SAM-dependent methyltransferase|nr:methyltransferase domain-containing protein [Gaiellaceae bacterium]